MFNESDFIKKFHQVDNMIYIVEENFKSCLLITILIDIVMISMANFLRKNYEMAHRSQKLQRENNQLISSKRIRPSRFERS